MQAVSRPAPGGEKVFAGQGAHVLLLLAFRTSEYVLLLHCTHVPGPLVSLYEPFGHASHAPPLRVPLYPGMHTQASNTLEPADTVLVPFGQARHADDDVAAVLLWYVPLTHGTHACAPVTDL